MTHSSNIQYFRDIGIKKESNNRGRNRNDRGRGGRGHGNDRKNSNLVQSHGLFSEGTALSTINKRSNSECKKLFGEK